MEALLGTDPHNKDTDGDGIPDGMDTYPLDANNEQVTAASGVHGLTDGLQFSVHNSFLSFFTGIISIVAIITIIFLICIMLRWLFTFMSELDHYEHHFNHDEDKTNTSYIRSQAASGAMNIGIPGLSLTESSPAHTSGLVNTPAVEEFEAHPRWAIVEGYMSSQVEALWRIGIMEADNMLREILVEKGYYGEDVGEMLKNARFKTVQLAWDAHTVRNKIAHEGSAFVLTAREAKRIFTLYESVFLELGAIR
jgi:hypothetical protein